MWIFAKKLGFVFFLLLSVFTVGQLIQFNSGGLKNYKITSPKHLLKVEDTHIETDINHILKQKFKYINKGCQTYVFISEDNKYILKLIRYGKYKNPFWSKHFKHNEFVNDITSHKKKLYKNSIHSYLLAKNYLKNQTKTIFINLYKTDIFKGHTIQLYDKLNRKFSCDLYNCAFIIQEKAQSFKDTLLTQKKANDSAGTRHILRSFLHMTLSYHQQNIENRDYNSLKNIGIVNNEAINIDLGSFYKNTKLQNKKILKAKIHNFSKYLKNWLKTNYPEGYKILKEELNALDILIDNQALTQNN